MPKKPRSGWHRLVSLLIVLGVLLLLAAAASPLLQLLLPWGLSHHQGTNDVHAIGFADNDVPYAILQHEGSMLWNVSSDTEMTRLGQNGEWGYSAISPDGKLAAIVFEFQQKIRVLSSDSLVEVASLPCRRSDYRPDLGCRLCFSPDGRFLAAMTENHIAVNDKGQPLSEKEIQIGPYPLTLKEEQCIQVWEIGTWRKVRQFDTDDSLDSIAVSTDGTVAAWEYKRNLRLWASSRPASTQPTTRADLPGEVMAFSPGGRWLAGGYWNRVAVAEVPSLVKSQEIVLTGLCTSVAFSPDGLHLAICGNTGQFSADGFSGSGSFLELWESPPGKAVRTMHIEFSGVLAECLAFSKDGSRCAVAGLGNKVMILNVLQRRIEHQYDLKSYPTPPRQ